MRDVEASRGHSFTRAAARFIVVLAVVVVSAVITHHLSDSLWGVVVVTVSGFVLAQFLVWIPAVFKALWGEVDQTHHWRSQVHPAAPGKISLLLWSECDHEVFEVRADIIEPSGSIVRSGLTDRTRMGRAPCGSHLGVGVYPDQFPGAVPIIDGQQYTVVWYGRLRLESPWFEIARQRFLTPPPVRFVQPRRAGR